LLVLQLPANNVNTANTANTANSANTANKNQNMSPKSKLLLDELNGLSNKNTALKVLTEPDSILEKHINKLASEPL